MFLFNGQAWSRYFVPGLGQALGPAWLVLVAIAAAGLIAGTLGIARGLMDSAVKSRHAGSTIRTSGAMKPNQAMAGVLALVGLATLIGYLLTPQPNLPGSFMYDFRFLLLTFLCGVFSLPIALSRSGLVWLFLPIYGVILIGTQFTHGLWLGQSTFYHSLWDGVIVGIPFVSNWYWSLRNEALPVEVVLSIDRGHVDCVDSGGDRRRRAVASLVPRQLAAPRGVPSTRPMGEFCPQCTYRRLGGNPQLRACTDLISAMTSSSLARGATITCIQTSPHVPRVAQRRSTRTGCSSL